MIQKLERKFGRYAIQGLMRYIIVLYALGYMLFLVQPDFYYDYLMLDIDKVLSGQLWRIVTFLIQPIDNSNVFFMLITLYLYYMIGNSLENRWGSFRFNLYYATGVLFNILAVVIIYVGSKMLVGYGISYPISLEFINLAMFLAFSVEFSEVQLLLFFVIPIKVKYLGIAYAALEIYSVVKCFLQGGIYGACIGVAFVTAMLNFLIFFFSTRNYRRIDPREINRRRNFRKQMNDARWQGQESSAAGQRVATRHRCVVCGRTELDDPDLEFRFCSKCEGNYEYCMDHLYTHTHVVREKKTDEKRPLTSGKE